MVITSLNIRDLGGKANKLSLQIFISVNYLDIVLVQETMGPSVEMRIFLEISIKGWLFIGLDASRKLGGLITS